MSRADKSMFYGLTNLLASVDEGEEAGLARAPKTWWRRGGADLVSHVLVEKIRPGKRQYFYTTKVLAKIH